MDYPDELKRRMDHANYKRLVELYEKINADYERNKSQIEFEKRVREILGEGWDG